MVKNRRFLMTETGKQQLKAELTYLTTEKKQAVTERIKKARTFCDFSEDSEFDAALAEQSRVDERIRVLKDMLRHAEIITKSEHQTVTVGATVTIVELPGDEAETYTIVGIAEADPFKNKISDRSPLAQALLGKERGDTVRVNLPTGQMPVKIIAIT